MTEKATVFQSTGAVSVAVDEDYVSIEQDSLVGDTADCVAIPRSLFKEVLNTIFARLDPWELDDIVEYADAHRSPRKEV